QTDKQEGLIRWVAHLREVSKHYWRGLFHTYDPAGVPRTNNDLESRLREVRRRVLRTTGQAGATVPKIPRVGAWELIGAAARDEEQVGVFAAVEAGEWEQERARRRQHQARFRLHTRDCGRAAQQLAGLRQAWLALPADAAG